MERSSKEVKSDLELLLGQFKDTDSLRFTVFSQIWRQNNFSQIFYGLLDHEKRSFSRLALDAAYNFLFPPFSFQIRVGGLYLLYSLYRCQTAAPPEQIRVALKDWDLIQAFEKDALEAQHLDVVYVLRQLGAFRAFHFTAMPTQLTFRKKRKTEKPASCVEFMERPSLPQELVNEELLEEMSNVHQHYMALKSSVSCLSDPTFNLSNRDLVPELRGAVRDFYDWQQKKKDKADDEDDAGEGTSSQQELQSSRRADLLSSIKAKAYGEATQAAKSRRHRQVEVEQSAGAAEAGPSHSGTRPRATKPSLKARTNQNICITGEMWKDANETTLINRLTSLESEPKEKRKK